jgi:hypothetical protein
MILLIHFWILHLLSKNGRLLCIMWMIPTFHSIIWMLIQYCSISIHMWMITLDILTLDVYYHNNIMR